MIFSALDNEQAEIKTNKPAVFDLTYFKMKGSTLRLEGYASIDGIFSFSEARIRKTLLLIPKIDIEAIRKANEHDEAFAELSDDDILKMYIVETPLNNCYFTEVKNYENSPIEDFDSLGGFKEEIDFSTILDGKPLKKGDYSAYIKLEQLSPYNDDIKHEKILPLSNVQKFLPNEIIVEELNFFSATLIEKYNLMLSFNHQQKTLRIENQMLQSYDPRLFTEEGYKRENKYIRGIKNRLFVFLYIIFNLLPIQKRKITFASDSRSDLSGNLYFVYEELYRRDLNLNIKFIFNERIDDRKSLFSLFMMAYHFATSKIIVLDDFYPLIYRLRIRKNAELVQVWHAAGAFKTFGFSRVGRPGGPSIKSKNHRNYTKATVSSEGVREHYAEGFGITLDKVIPTGVPRSDIFFDENYAGYVKKKLEDFYPFIKNKKVILFAPTFRGNGQKSAYFPYEHIDFAKLYEAFHEEYVFLFKIHPFVNNRLKIPYEYNDFFYDVSEFREINDLLFITDILITDYSSVCFEFALLNKPMLFFAFDVEEYIQERDFYYDYFDFIPGPLVKDTEEVIETIQKGDFQLEKIKPFVKYFFNDTLGKASKNVVDDVIIPGLESKYIKEEKEKMLPPPKSRLELFDRSLQEVEEEQLNEPS